MPLSKQTLDALQHDYVRLLAEADAAALEYRRRREEALRVAAFLHDGGRDVTLPMDANTEVALGNATSAKTAASHGVEGRAQSSSQQPSNADLDAAIFDAMAKRPSGFKPSELTNRLQKEGFQGTPHLHGRVVRRLLELSREGRIARSQVDNRYQGANLNNGSAQEAQQRLV